MQVRALLFDIGGTVFDWHTPIVTTLRRHREFAGLDHAGFARECRAAFLEEAGVAAEGVSGRRGSDEMLAGVMDALLARSGLLPDATVRRDLHDAWRRMPAWRGARDGLRALRLTYPVLPLTILSWPMAAGSSRVSGLEWDGFLCCEMIGSYKPDPDCYARAAEIVDCRPEEIAMVAAHPSDLRAASLCGYRTVYVLPQIEDPGEDYHADGLEDEFDLVAADFDDLATRLSPGAWRG
ncbi:HAD-IA family hydrolase [Defluviimonas sp. WL0024]|uniref:HAD-IA family hydrolase n=1 Tax=Albidovulum salinarum TaxID=2984153 RepID=A0ABT2X595_9RHOB|nr:HAD-IA family hydrolase [Defluviimonas sp. WL0024]MCU9849101.1 HAD-IA family hydrolase [Defluviimonas sp. WL0024]